MTLKFQEKTLLSCMLAFKVSKKILQDTKKSFGCYKMLKNVKIILICKIRESQNFPQNNY